MLTLKILDRDGHIVAESQAAEREKADSKAVAASTSQQDPASQAVPTSLPVPTSLAVTTSLVVTREYEEGDRILVETSDKNVYVWLQLDDALGKSLVYLTGDYEYRIPFGEKRVCYSPKAFYGNRHLLTIREAADYEIQEYRNLAVNVNDQHGNTVCYPRASANVETRGESVFAAMNAIDGVTENRSHGEWPYASWGINRQDDAMLRLDFGRPVKADTIVLYTRADFPHDNWWISAVVTFSDGEKMTLPMEKSVLPHIFSFESRTIEWLELSELIKADDPSPFPALTQIEVYGTPL